MDPNQLTLASIAIALGVLGLKKMWVFGWTYADKEKDLDDMTVDRNFWRDTALKSMGHTDKALDKLGTTGPVEG